MNVENILEGCAVIGVDVFFLGLFYKLYKQKAKCLKGLQDAEQLEINSELLKKIQASGGIIPYAVISGKVKPLSKPLLSEHVSEVKGVIREKITQEYKIQWIPTLRIWSTTHDRINREMASVPFMLCGKSGLFQKRISVEIIEPFSSEGLILSEVWNDMKRYEESFSEAVIGLLCREHTVGIRQLENMLLEDTTLTAIGKLSVEDNAMKISTPDGGLTYFLSSLSYDSLVKKVSQLEKFYKALTVVMCIVTAGLLSYFLKKIYSDIRRRIIHARDLRKCREARKVKRTSNQSQPPQDESNCPKCVICLDAPVEIVILECGHACLCLTCSEQMQTTLCPVCRNRIDRLVPVFMP